MELILFSTEVQLIFIHYRYQQGNIIVTFEAAGITSQSPKN